MIGVLRDEPDKTRMFDFGDIGTIVIIRIHTSSLRLLGIKLSCLSGYKYELEV